MNKNNQKTVWNKPIVLLAMLLTGLNPAVADDADFNKWKCKLCPVYTGWSGNLFFGSGFSSDDDLRFGDFRGQDEKGLYLAIDGELHYQNQQGQYFNLYSRDLGLDSRQLEIQTGKQGSYEFRFGWNEIPKYRGYNSQTPFLGAGTDNLSLPAGWVAAVETGGMSQLNNSLVDTSQKTLRKTLDAGMTLKFASNWEYQLDFQKQKKKGSRAFAAGLFFNNASEFPVPVDFTTDQVDMGLSWFGKRGQLRFALTGSWFNNAYNSVTWENPFTSPENTQTLRVALEPDNKYYQFSVNGAFALSPKMRVSGQASIGKVSQNEAFIPYSINPAYSDIALPRSSLLGKLDTSSLNLAGKFYARLSRKLTLTARVKLNERDNKTPIDLYTPVVTDLILFGERYNRPYSYERKKYSVDLRFRPHSVLRLSTGVKYEDMDRSLQAVENSKETTWWGELRLNPSLYVQVRMKGENSKRDISDYLQPDDGGSIDHPLLRKFNQADRDRKRTQLELDINPVDALGINLSYFYANDDYSESLIGLQSSDEQSYTVDLNYVINKNINIYAFLTEDDIDAKIKNATSANATPWNARTKDSITTMGLGLSTKISNKFSLGFDVLSSNSTGEISVRTNQNEAPFAPLRTKLKNTRIHLDYQANDKWAYKLYTEFEEYKSSDWAIDGVDAISSVLSLGTQSPNYNAWILRLQVSYRF